MLIFHTFLFAFSLRLGGIIIGTVTLLKSVIWMIVQFWGLECTTQFSNFFKDIMEDQPLFSRLDELLHFYEGLEYYLIGLAVFYALNTFICFFLLIGAYYCKLNFIYPFLWFYVIYTFLLCMDMTFIFFIIANSHDGLETTIIYFSVAFFVLVYCIYTWCCVFSLTRVIQILQRKVLEDINFEGMRQKGNIPQLRRTAFKRK